MLLEKEEEERRILVERNICPGSFEEIVGVLGQRRSQLVLDGWRAEGEGDWLRIRGEGEACPGVSVVSGTSWRGSGRVQGARGAKLGLAAGS